MTVNPTFTEICQNVSFYNNIHIASHTHTSSLSNNYIGEPPPAVWQTRQHEDERTRLTEVERRTHEQMMLLPTYPNLQLQLVMVVVLMVASNCITIVPHYAHHFYALFAHKHDRSWGQRENTTPQLHYWSFVFASTRHISIFTPFLCCLLFAILNHDRRDVYPPFPFSSLSVYRCLADLALILAMV